MSIFTRNKAQTNSNTNTNNAFYIGGNTSLITEEFQGKVVQDIVKFPKELGVEHPFDFLEVEGLYKKFGFVTGVVDKYVDFIVSGFYVTCKDEKAKTIIDQWMQDVDFDTILRAWVREGILKGNGYLEIGDNNEVKLLDSKYLWVERDDYGVITGYNQYLGSAKNKINFSKEVIPFDTNKIAHLKINCVSTDAYGMGVVYPASSFINDFLGAQKEMHGLMKRKANAPIVATLGDHTSNPPLIPSDDVVNAFGKKLEWLNNKHEWSVGTGVKMEVLNFGNVGEKFNFILEHDSKMLFFAFQVPEVLMGGGSIPEGLAQVQMDAWKRNIESKQAEIEKVIEQKIFKRVLNNNNLDIHVEFEWGKSSDEEKNKRVDIILRLMSNMSVSPALLEMAQKDLANQLGYDADSLDSDFELMRKQRQDAINAIARNKDETKSQPIVPGQNNNEKKNIYCELPHSIEESADHSLNEWLGFEYGKYLESIIDITEVDRFELLRAVSDFELSMGKFSEEQVQALRDVFVEGFSEGKSIKDISRMIKTQVKPADLIVTDDYNNITRIIPASIRPIMIARTESTRLANSGAMKDYAENGIEKVRWVAALSDRTCPQCSEYNGMIFDVSTQQPPAHVMCRCTMSPVVELR